MTENEQPPSEAASASSTRRHRLRERFRDLFVGTTGSNMVTLAPTVPVKEIFRFFWPYARPYRKWIVVAIILIIAVPALQGAKLYMIKVTVDEVLTPKDLDPFIWIAPVVLALTIFGGIFQFGQKYLTTWVGERFLLGLRKDFFGHLQGLSLDFFERRRLGDVISRLTGDINAIESFVLSGVADGLSSIAKIVFFMGALFFLDWKLALVSLLVAPAFALLVRWVSRRVKDASREKRRRSGTLTAVAEESLSNVALVQAYNRQQDEVDRFARENRGAFDASMVVARLKSMFPPLIDIIQTVSGLAVLGIGAKAIQDGEMSLGALLVFFAYLNQLYSPIRGLAALYNLIYAASAGAERVIEFYNARPSIVDRPGAPPLEVTDGAIVFDDVTFAYPARPGEPAIEDVSFRVESGQTLALVGHSGAGKSTIAKLLLRFYDPASGQVTIDGADLRDIQLDSLREKVSVLLQETLIFDGTIRDNISYGRRDATESEIIAAARAADAHEFIESLPEGYDTSVGQKGRRLSGGQRQRIAIARSMIRDAPILILDEPTTGLDAESGHRILEPLRRLMSGRTAIVISHNLITVRDAHQILVLDDGHIVERGTHDELVAQDGAYARLVRLHELGSTIDGTGAVTTPG